MHHSQALGIINITAPEQIQTLADFLPLDIIQQDFSLTDTLRKRKLSLESMGWLVMGMAIYNGRPLSLIVNLMDIVDRTEHPFTAPSSVIQHRKILGEEAIKALFQLTQQQWNHVATPPPLAWFATPRRRWRGLESPGYPAECRRLQQKP